MFIDEIKKNENAEAFIIKNLKLNKGKLKEALKELQNKQVNLARIQIVRKNNYVAHYTGFMTVTIDP